MAIIILTAGIFCLIACAPQQKAGLLDPLKLSAAMKIEGERNGVAFSAEIRIGDEREDGTRSGELIFTFPESFAGLCVRSDSGVWSAELDEAVVSGKAAEALGAPLSPFMQKNNAVGAELIKKSDGGTATLITVESGGGSFELLLDGESGYPVLLREKNGAGEIIMEYKITEYKIEKRTDREE